MSETYRQEIDIQASVETVFDYFIKPEMMVRWMGEFARLEAKEGGLFSVDIDGVLIRGQYTRIERPGLIEIAWGEAGNDVMPPGSTRLLIVLREKGEGTFLTLTHSGLVPEEAEKHAFGWPVFLERLAVASVGGNPGSYPWTSKE